MVDGQKRGCFLVKFLRVVFEVLKNFFGFWVFFCLAKIIGQKMVNSLINHICLISSKKSEVYLSKDA